MDKVEIVGGLNLEECINGGTIFEVNLQFDKQEFLEKEKECINELQNYLKLECLDLYDGEVSFENLAKKMQDLIPNGKIKKRILRQGYGTTPEQGKNVRIQYNAYLQSEAEPFDSTYARKKPFEFIIGNNEVIEGLETAVLSMQLNEKSQFLIDPELAYRGGSLGRIPPNSLVLFEVELCDIKQTQKENILELDDKNFIIVYPNCLALCVKGNTMFKGKDYTGAIKVYSTAVAKLEEAILRDYDDQLKSEELLVRLYTNLLVCCTHAQIPKKGCIYAQRIYDMAKNGTFTVSAKIYFNHAKCARLLGNFEIARKKLSIARKLEPINKEILEECKMLQEAKDKYKRDATKFGKALVRSA